MTMLFGVETVCGRAEGSQASLGTHGGEREGKRGALLPHTASYGERRRGNEPPAAVSSAAAAASSVSIKNRQSCFLRRPASFNATVANALRQCGDMKPAICCCCRRCRCCWGVVEGGVTPPSQIQ